MADFIGETNFLTGTAEGDAGASGDRAIVIGVSPEGRSGPITLAVRPEQVRLRAAGAEGSLPATVADTVYFGTDTHCHLALDDGTEIVARLQSAALGRGRPAARRGGGRALRRRRGRRCWGD